MLCNRNTESLAQLGVPQRLVQRCLCNPNAARGDVDASKLQAGQENSLEAMRIFGGYGYSKEYNVERLYRDAPLLVIGEGTNELQRIIIARQLVARNPA